MSEREKKCAEFFVNEILSLYEFEVYISEWSDNEVESQYNRGQKVFKVKDLQGGNLWNIENDEFKSFADIIDRMECYHNDYIYEDIDNGYSGNDDYGVKIIASFLESKYVAEALEKITPYKHLDFLNIKQY